MSFGGAAWPKPARGKFLTSFGIGWNRLSPSAGGARGVSTSLSQAGITSRWTPGRSSRAYSSSQKYVPVFLREALRQKRGFGGAYGRLRDRRALHGPHRAVLKRYAILRTALVFVLRTGCQRKALPKERFGSASSVHKSFRQWLREGFFLSLWRAGLCEYDEMEGTAWKWEGVRFLCVWGRL